MKIVAREGVKIYVVSPGPGKLRFEKTEVTSGGGRFMARWRYASQPDDIVLHVTFLNFGSKAKPSLMNRLMRRATVPVLHVSTEIE